MSFNFDITTPVIILLSISSIAAIIIIFIYAPFVRRGYRRARQCKLTVDSPDDAKWPSASVIIYAQGEAERLEALLPDVLGQDYGGAFEVIVVNEGDSADVRNVISALQLANRNLYLTFTPDGARNLSRKKLALTLGIKAARNPVVVLTTADAIIDSNQWLTKMMRHFSSADCGIVLGYAAPDNDATISRLCSFDYSSDSVAWLSPAIGHRPFRGTELNIAYRRELFFANKGFSRSLNLHFGDDDIFISEIADRRNTVVELSPESIVRFNSYDMPSTLRDTAIRHCFTSRFIRRMPLPWLTVGETAFWITILTSAAAIVLDYNNIVTISAATLLIIAGYVAIAVAWRNTSVALMMRRLTFCAPLLALIQPFRRMSLSIRSSLSKHKKYTWD